MKKLWLQALDWRNPRSLWHRDLCGCIGVCCTIALAGIGLVGTGVLGVVGLFVLLHLGGITLRFSCDLSVWLALDDSNHTLAQMADALNQLGSDRVPHYHLIAVIVYTVLLVIFTIVPLVALANRLWHRHYGEAMMALTLPLIPLVVPALLTVTMGLFAGLLNGTIGLIADATAAAGGQKPADLHKRPSAHAMLDMVVPAVLDRASPFYGWLLALSVTSGVLVGVLGMAFLLIGLPLIACCKLAHDDVAATLHDLDV